MSGNWLAASFAAAVPAAWLGGRWWLAPERRARRALARARRVRVADLVDGQAARVVGTVVDGEHLTAPLSGRACVYYETTVRNVSDRGIYRQSEVRDERGVRFWLDDGTGRVLIDARDAVVATAAHLDESSVTSGLGKPRTEAQLRFLASQGHESQMWLAFEERSLAVGATIAVAGVATHAPDPDGGAPRLALIGTPKRPLVASDRPELTR